MDKFKAIVKELKTVLKAKNLVAARKAATKINPDHLQDPGQKKRNCTERQAASCIKHATVQALKTLEFPADEQKAEEVFKLYLDIFRKHQFHRPSSNDIANYMNILIENLREHPAWQSAAKQEFIQSLEKWTGKSVSTSSKKRKGGAKVNKSKAKKARANPKTSRKNKDKGKRGDEEEDEEEDDDSKTGDEAAEGKEEPAGGPAGYLEMKDGEEPVIPGANDIFSDLANYIPPEYPKQGEELNAIETWILAQKSKIKKLRTKEGLKLIKKWDGDSKKRQVELELTYEETHATAKWLYETARNMEFKAEVIENGREHKGKGGKRKQFSQKLAYFEKVNTELKEKFPTLDSTNRRKLSEKRTMKAHTCRSYLKCVYNLIVGFFKTLALVRIEDNMMRTIAKYIYFYMNQLIGWFHVGSSAGTYESDLNGFVGRLKPIIPKAIRDELRLMLFCGFGTTSSACRAASKARVTGQSGAALQFRLQNKIPVLETDILRCLMITGRQTADVIDKFIFVQLMTGARKSEILGRGISYWFEVDPDDMYIIRTGVAKEKKGAEGGDAEVPEPRDDVDSDYEMEEEEQKERQKAKVDEKCGVLKELISLDRIPGSNPVSIPLYSTLLYPAYQEQEEKLPLEFVESHLQEDPPDRRRMEIKENVNNRTSQGNSPPLPEEWDVLYSGRRRVRNPVLRVSRDENVNYTDVIDPRNLFNAQDVRDRIRDIQKEWWTQKNERTPNTTLVKHRSADIETRIRQFFYLSCVYSARRRVHTINSHFLRKIYANYSYDTCAPRDRWTKTAWLAKHLGWKPETALHTAIYYTDLDIIRLPAISGELPDPSNAITEIMRRVIADEHAKFQQAIEQGGELQPYLAYKQGKFVKEAGAQGVQPIPRTIKAFVTLLRAARDKREATISFRGADNEEVKLHLNYKNKYAPANLQSEAEKVARALGRSFGKKYVSNATLRAFGFGAGTAGPVANAYHSELRNL